jgi:hypothetical protein
MQIKIDPEKDSTEKLEIVAKIIEGLKQQKTIEKPKKQQPKKKQIKLSKKDNFLSKKYKFYIMQTLMHMSNRSINPEHETNNLEPLDEVYVDKESLLDEFKIILKESNIHSISQLAYEKALKSFENKENISNACGIQFFLEKEDDVYKVIF